MNILSNKKMLLLWVAMSGTAFAWTPHDSTNDWNVASGNAGVAANFDPATAPGANTFVRVNNGGEMAIDSNLSWGALWAGITTTGIVRHTSGTLTVNNPGQETGDGTFVLGYNGGVCGRYYLSGGRFVCADGNLKVGWNGLGMFDISGGELQTGGFPSIGMELSACGHVNVSGSGVFNSTSAWHTLVGERGVGVVTVRDGGMVRTGKIVLGSASTAKGIVNVGPGGVIAPASVVSGAGSVARVNALGGTVKPGMASDVSTNFMENVNVSVGAGGFVFDSEGKSVTLGASLVPSRLVKGNLVHRWSFNGDTKDSVGSMDAELMGAYKAYTTYVNGEEIRLSGRSDLNGKEYIALGAGCIPSGTNGATIEMWLTREGGKTWSRAFTCGSDLSGAPNNTMFIAWTGNHYLYLKTDGTEKSATARLGTWTTGVKYHLTIVFEKRTSDWNIEFCRRDPETGAVRGRWTTTAPLAWDPSSLASAYFNLGYSQVAGDPSSCTRYDEVRIWNTALTDDELIESTTRGPDADFSSAPCLRKTGEGTLALASTAAYDGETRVEAGVLALRAPEIPVHRWSFENGSLADANTGSDAVRVGSSASGIVATSDGKGLLFPGASHNGAYMKLGKGKIPLSDSGVTFEVWATLLGLRTWERIFTITTDSTSDLCFMTWVGDSANNSYDYVGFRYNAGSVIMAPDKLAPYELERPYHIAVVFLPKGGGSWAVQFYKQNAATGTLEKSHEMALPNGWTPSRLETADIVLAWSTDAGNDDANARYDEVRVWDRAFTEDEIVASGNLGPDTLPRFASTSGVAGALPTDTALAIDSGATFLLGGASQTVAALSGNGSIEGAGTLTVTDAIRPGGVSAVGVLTIKNAAKLVGTVELDLRADGSCDRIDFVTGGTYDISGIHWTVANLADTASCDSFIVANASGVTLTGEIDASGLPANHVIKQTRDGNLVFKRISGLMLIVK